MPPDAFFQPDITDRYPQRDSADDDDEDVKDNYDGVIGVASEVSEYSRWVGGFVLLYS